MSASNLIRWGALAAMVGGVVFLAYPFLFLIFEFGGVALAIALLLVPMGMVGFHTLQRQSYGNIGRVGFWFLVAGPLVVVLSGAVFFTLGKSGNFLQASPPLVWVVSSLLGLVAGVVGMVVGLGLYGVATLHAGVLPRWCGVAFVAPAAGAALALAVAVLGALAFEEPSNYDVQLYANLMLFLLRFSLFFQGFLLAFSLMFGLAWLPLSYALWARREAPIVQQLRRVH